MLYFSVYTIIYIDGQLKIWATQYCLLRWSRMRTGCLCTQEDLCASLWTHSAKLTTCLTKSSLHQVCLARENFFVARFFKRFLLFGAGNTYGVDTGYGNFTGVVGGFELFRIFLSYNVSCWRWTFWRWEWYRGERWTSEEACSPSWRRERWTLNACWPKFLISKNIFTFCFVSGGGGLQQRHQCWGKYNLDENSKVILYIVLSEQLFSTASF